MLTRLQTPVKEMFCEIHNFKLNVIVTVDVRGPSFGLATRIDGDGRREKERIVLIFESWSFEWRRTQVNDLPETTIATKAVRP